MELNDKKNTVDIVLNGGEKNNNTLNIECFVINKTSLADYASLYLNSNNKTDSSNNNNNNNNNENNDNKSKNVNI
jgi:hypothetical protein